MEGFNKELWGGKPEVKKEETKEELKIVELPAEEKNEELAKRREQVDSQTDDLNRRFEAGEKLSFSEKQELARKINSSLVGQEKEVFGKAEANSPNRQGRRRCWAEFNVWISTWR